MPSIEQLHDRRRGIIADGIAHHADEAAWRDDVDAAIRRERALLAALDEVDAELEALTSRTRAHRSPTPPRRRPQPKPQTQTLSPVEVDLSLATRLRVELEARIDALSPSDRLRVHQLNAADGGGWSSPTRGRELDSLSVYAWRPPAGSIYGDD